MCVLFFGEIVDKKVQFHGHKKMERIIALQGEIALLTPPFDKVKVNSSDEDFVLFNADIAKFELLKKKEEIQLTLKSCFSSLVRMIIDKLTHIDYFYSKPYNYDEIVKQRQKWFHDDGTINPHPYNIIEWYSMILETFEKNLHMIPYKILNELIDEITVLCRGPSRHHSCGPAKCVLFDQFSYENTFLWLIKKEMLTRYNSKLQELETLRIAYMFSQCVIETKMHQKTSVKEVEPVQVNRYKPCIICEENDANICYISCGHILTCKNCSKDIMECPICKKDVLSLIKIYL